MITRLHVSSFVGLTIVVWLAALWFQGQPVLSLSFLKPFSLVVGVLAAFSVAFNIWIWRLPILRGWYIKIPYIRGTWRIDLKSDWIDPNTQKGIEPIQCYLVVRQTLSSLSARLITPESISHSVAYSITLESDEIYRLHVVYRNEPKIELQGVRSEIHHGAFKMEITCPNYESMDGFYWSDRKTRGSMRGVILGRQLCDSYESASKLSAG
ncbi:hypothetical protein [Synoicihabitans lomoniglobus]|uniref:CD-NTase-associated protein 15 domain-containing protein n=1 Tax=Synoicihabitans lomoniglobus TaxID=2909285 RepID=A0AAE9ZSB9_9BACT|nr:hypothetical protein [Opitutaceae bacterium LMO-M01]WED64335.1 hypothetical protein PXH66_18510 [Opitutaceae bacterium LMO-M01]